jgi:sigma-B regulation protein RsbU (phosphoserine phosphatase)
MDHPLVDLLFALIRNIAVVMILAYLLARLPAFGDILNRRSTGKGRLMLVLVFGLFSIYGTASGVEILGVVVNFRDLGPAAAGLLAGPLTGAGAGIIGALYRYPLGGLTALPCAIATVLAGLLGGVLFLLRRGKTIRIREAVLLMAGVEILHGLITLLILGPSQEVMTILSTAVPPMILANGAGIGIFIFILNNLARERHTEAAKQRLDSELSIAREIQMSMIPQTRPAASGGSAGAELHATLRPAREVGGDLYNFFPLADGRLCLAVGDVAGKGVPASLYMAITQKLIKAVAREGGGPADLMTRLNRELSEDNEATMFVTLFLAAFDARTGNVRMANAGHNPPCLLGADGPRLLALDPGIALGVAADFTYREESLRLGPGETLFLYTDGVTEAMDPQGNLYSERRLLAALGRLSNPAPAALCEALLQDLALFVGAAEQSDDITLLALRRSTGSGL